MKTIYFEKIDSTNKYAKENIETLADKTIIIADFQTNGYGQFRRAWHDAGGENIYMTFVLKPKSLQQEHVNLTKYLAEIVCLQLEEIGLSPVIKAPNDVLINGKKVCGILAESITKGNKLKGIALGIGINLNSKAENLEQIDQPATSVSLELGHAVNKQEFTGKIIEKFFMGYEDFIVES